MVWQQNPDLHVFRPPKLDFKLMFTIEFKKTNYTYLHKNNSYV